MKLKGGTIVESLVAMVILVVALGTATMIYSNIMLSDRQVKKQKALSFLNEELSNVLKERRYLDLEKIKEGLNLRLTFKQYPGTQDVTQLVWSVSDENENKILAGAELFYMP